MPSGRTKPYGAGEIEFGQPGVGDRNIRLYPIKIEAENTWTSIAAWAAHTLTLKPGGNNDYGQLSFGDQEHRDIPTSIGIESEWVYVSAGIINPWFSSRTGVYGPGEIMPSDK